MKNGELENGELENWKMENSRRGGMVRFFWIFFGVDVNVCMYF
jgi:hypothetical protein